MLRKQYNPLAVNKNIAKVASLGIVLDSCQNHRVGKEDQHPEVILFIRIRSMFVNPGKQRREALSITLFSYCYTAL